SLMRDAPINPSAISNSEVSELALQILAASPITSSIISDSLENQACDIATSKSAWCSYMIHIGGLTFCNNSKHLQIPNLVAAEHFGEATLTRLKLCLEDVDLAFRNIVSGGSICQALALYKRTMEIHDVGESDFKKTEENHRDSFHYALLGNTHPSLQKIGLETQITKVVQQTSGRIDMLIQVPLKKRAVLLEWKAIQIDFLDVGKSQGCKEKVGHLSDMADANEILDLQFSWYDLWRPGQTIQSWITDGPIKGDNKISPRQQLAEYVNSPDIALLKKENEPKQPDAYTGKIDTEECLNFTDSCEEYYTILQLAEPLWVKYIVLNLTGDACSWWCTSGLTIETPWIEFHMAFIMHFTPPDSVNKARKSLKKLKQGRTSVAAYTAEFWCYLRLIPNMDKDDALYVYLMGLEPDTSKQVRLWQPTSIDVAIMEATIMYSILFPNGFLQAQAPAHISSQVPVDPMAMEIDNLCLKINALHNAIRGTGNNTGYRAPSLMPTDSDSNGAAPVLSAARMATWPESVQTAL
ncbi:hypothetical protein BGZ98_004366, partial [Dissophora globulifera]